jgi:hypothetical protein
MKAIENTTQPPLTVLDRALKYRELGFPVIPVYKRTKNAAINWEVYQTRMSTEEEIKEWFTKTTYNVAIVLGNISNSLEIDIDGEQGRRYFEDVFTRLTPNLQSAIKNTMRIVSANGLKLLFKFISDEWPQGIRTNNGLWKGKGKHNRIDLRANGSYSVGVGSVHPDGTLYALADGSEFNPLTLSKLEIEGFIDEICGEKLEEDNKYDIEQFDNSANSHGSNITDGIIRIELPTNIINKVAEDARKYYLDGIRNDFTLGFVGELRKSGVSYEDAYKLAYLIDPSDAKNLNRIKYIFNHKGWLAGKGYLVRVLTDQMGLNILQTVKVFAELFGPIQELGQQRLKQEKEEKVKDRTDNKKVTNNGPKEFTSNCTVPEKNKKPPADILYDLAKIAVSERFIDQNTNEMYAVYTINGRKEVHSMESVEFEYFLRQIFENNYAKQQEYFRSRIEAENSGVLSDFLEVCKVAGLKVYPHEKIIGKEHLRNVIQQLKATVTDKKKLYIRSFYQGGTLRYDLMNDKGTYVEIDEKNGVRICEGSYQYFKRYDDNHAQVEPSTSDDDISKGRRLFDNLISSFNISEDNAEGDKQLLLKAYWISLYFNTDPKFPMPIPTVAGPHDSAKSTLLGTIKYHVDPVNSITSLVDKWGQRDDHRRRGLIVSRNNITYFDNMSHLTNDESDELCLYATGADYQERRLHTNTDIVRYQLQANIGYNGINDLAKNPDLLSRIIPFELGELKQKIPFSEYWKKREEERPLILGYIFNIIKLVIPRYQNDAYKICPVHRLTDFVVLGELIAQELGEKPGRFLKIFENITEEQSIRAIENNSFAQILIEHIFSREYKDTDGRPITKWETTTSNWNSELVNFAKSKSCNISDDWDFPNNAVGLGIRLNKLRSTLLRVGIKIEKKKDRANSKWIIEILKEDNDNRKKIDEQEVLSLS